MVKMLKEVRAKGEPDSSSSLLLHLRDYSLKLIGVASRRRGNVIL
jgi:hypothetical protein